ncbi:hypothetical protein crov188 [Cafeteria roenbergensis virus]|uniref:Uncharacterized protein n=1 Tax=Cafeteria roenbergensis virus (strain BV-PW1) TaxID=693272 RepID=E3T4V8_CROVB|nr:hypothetical protein crov188 [Cafeteria roenbergensis virus BV-PW1]ADO67221.1 hypothetical protein crov188 [Cafeteria roenbergensis virus BV-PW1]
MENNLSNLKKINKLKKLIEETEDNDERDFLEYALSKKINNNITEKSIKDPLINIITKEKIDILEKIFKNKIKINWNKYIYYSKPPLHLAIENGDIKMMKLLLKNNYPLWLPDKNNHTPFELVCLYKDPGLINSFINLGADIKKILYLRNKTKNIKFYHSNIDFLILAKKILIEENNIKHIRQKIKTKTINITDLIGLEDFTWEELRLGLMLYLKIDFPDLLNLMEIINNSNNYSDYLIFNFLFELDFNFKIEDDKYFILELEYNKSIMNYENLKNKFYKDYLNVYSNDFLDIIWYKFINKN